ncbi:hypothetical protein PSYPI_23662 [Pseudomonas syringae pv. pisi str. 1704B]|uniref:Uncharacterized protein n=1 Tax=Pseudomonas syringae pv. pisi str. 1704B TaxID=629263 RepID=F3GDL2_PSESJ|nr:hypothetical protein PSYPI_23662 [Pseudomonas syringae pv. pisi str. 1704B]
MPPKPAKLEANVTDLHALVKAVYEGRAPISVLTVNWARWTTWSIFKALISKWTE